MNEENSSNFKMHRLSDVDLLSSCSDDLIRGLSARDALVPTAYYYDDRRSEIFQQLCEEDSYYLPKAELRILREKAPSIISALEGRPIIELGCGDCHKTVVLLDESMKALGECKFIPIDVSGYALEEAGERITNDIEGVEIEAICGTYDQAVSFLSAEGMSRGVYLFLGSTMAQFTDEMIGDFLNLSRRAAKPGDLFLVGFDLYKEAEKLSAPYNTISAIRHQLNALDHINRLYDGNIHTDAVGCEGRWIEGKKRIEMTLCFRKEQNVVYSDSSKTRN